MVALNVFELDFYNDWVNGSLYYPIFKIKERSDGTFKFCDHDRPSSSNRNNFIGESCLNTNTSINKGLLSGAANFTKQLTQKDDIDMLIPHQANLRIAQFIQRKFQLPDDKVYNNIMKYGNTTAASIIIALTEAWELGKIKDNDLVVLAAFGSGFTWGSVVIRW